MKVGVCWTKRTVDGDDVMGAVARGIQEHGDEVVHIRKPRDVEQDVDCYTQICTYNRPIDTDTLHKPQYVFRKKILDHCIATGKRLLILDSGMILGGAEYNIAKEVGDKADPDFYFSAGWDGLKRYAWYYPRMSNDRWAATGLELHPFRYSPDKPILVIGQVPYGAGCQGVDCNQWFRSRLSKLGEEIGRKPKVIIRAHGRLYFKPHRRKYAEDLTVKAVGDVCDYTVSNKMRLSDDLADAGITLCYSSNAAVRSIVEGVPVVLGSDISMAWNVVDHNSKFLFPYVPHDSLRRAWAQYIGYTQWRKSELASGAMWNHHKSYATGRSLLEEMETRRGCIP